MKKSELCRHLREFVQAEISPTQEQRELVSDLYAAAAKTLRPGSCVQIGSYARFTAIRPLHDLDILYCMGDWEGVTPSPTATLNLLAERFIENFENPTRWSFEVSVQSHSICVSFKNALDAEAFAIDVVPGYADGQNEFGDPVYRVPEIAERSRTRAQQIYEQIQAGQREMGWIRTDPRGYTSVATALNKSNSDFRRAVKILKSWKGACKAEDDSFRLKSFHIEQAIADLVEREPTSDIFELFFGFLTNLEDYLKHPRFPDRADASRHIDGYVAGISTGERIQMLKYRDGVLVRLESIKDQIDVAEILYGGPYERASSTEQFLFDQQIPMFHQHDFEVIGTVEPRKGGFRREILDRIGLIRVDRAVSFSIGAGAPRADLFKWKVRNDRNCPQPRGEITDNHTLHDPERTKYRGSHFVQCFAIKDGVGIGVGTQRVKLDTSVSR